MINYFRNSKLIKNNLKYEVYLFEIPNDLCELLKSNSINEIDANFDHNIISIPDSKNNVFSLSTDKCNSNQNLVNVDRNNNLLKDFGTFEERIIVKENYQLNTNNKRKLNSDHSNDCEPSAKRRVVNQMNDSDNDAGSILSTQSRNSTAYSLKTKIKVLDELKLGKSLKQISIAFNISETKVKEFLSKESEIRRQFKEAIIDREELNNSSSQPPIVRQNKLVKSNVKSADKLIKSQPNSQKLIEKSPSDDSSKCVLNLDFELTKENGRLVFSDTLKRAASVGLQNFSFQLPKDHPDIPKPDLPHYPVNPKRTSIANPVKKPSTNHGNSLSNPQITVNDKGVKISSVIKNSIIQESKKLPQSENKQLQPEKKSTNVTESFSKKVNENPNQANHNKHSNDSVLKIQQIRPMAKPKSSTNQSKPVTIQSPFKYIVVDPSTIDFVPSESVDPDLKSTNVESEEFINEAQKLYERFTECAKFYNKYRSKRDDLKDRVSKIRSDQDISELYKEFYRIVEEEKRPFFVNLEKEVTILQSKLTKVADLLGVKLNI